MMPDDPRLNPAALEALYRIIVELDPLLGQWMADTINDLAAHPEAMHAIFQRLHTRLLESGRETAAHAVADMIDDTFGSKD